MRRKFQSVLLTIALVCSMLLSDISVNAQTLTDGNLETKRGYEPITVFRVSTEGFKDMPAIEKIPSTEIPLEDQRYWKQFSSDYYYNYFLNDAEKAFWNELENMCITMATTEQNYSKQPTGDTYLSDVIDRWVPCDTSVPEDRMIDLMYLFMNSNPQYYFLSNEIGFTYTSWGDLYGGILVLYDEFTNGQTRKNYTRQFTGRIDAWLADAEQQVRPEEKVKRAHDIICQNVVYKANAFDQSAYSLVCMGESVCSGYAATTQMMLNSMGIECLFVASKDHAWNMVQLHGVWYGLDVTWNDGDNNQIYYRFYNKSRDTFRRDGHEEEIPYCDMLVDAPYDMFEGDNYVSPYFTRGNINYFRVNDNEYLADLLVKPLDTSISAPLTVNHNRKTYQVIGGSAEVGGVEDSSEQVMAFVERMYTVALGRNAEESGANYWAEQLLAGENDGAGIARGFFLSPEFMNSGHSNNEYVKRLYRTFFDREPAEEEVNYWMGKLANGESREFVLSGFVNSNEFDVLCSGFGISRGFLRQNGEAINPGISQFAERLYTKVLERAGEKEGVEYWTLLIADGVCTPEAAAKSFFKSPEYQNKKTSNTHYIEACYRTFMGREAEPDGMVYWKNVMANGATRDDVLAGFAASAEFQQILREYGL